MGSVEIERVSITTRFLTVDDGETPNGKPLVSWLEIISHKGEGFEIAIQDATGCRAIMPASRKDLKRLVKMSEDAIKARTEQ